MSDRPKLAVVDYGIGNLRSAEKALIHVGADARLTSDPATINAADGIVVPGVGAFGKCIDALHEVALFEPLRVIAGAAVTGDGPPFLGICVGLQMLFESSQESPGTAGLGIFPGEVSSLPDTVKRPQMQWNPVTVSDPDHWLWRSLDPAPWLYFVHTYRAPLGAEVAATCDYGGEVVAAVARGKLVATQFHPEKSGSCGLQVLANFADACTT